MTDFGDRWEDSWHLGWDGHFYGQHCKLWGDFTDAGHLFGHSPRHWNGFFLLYLSSHSQMYKCKMCNSASKFRWDEPHSNLFKASFTYFFSFIFKALHLFKKLAVTVCNLWDVYHRPFTHFTHTLKIIIWNSRGNPWLKNDNYHLDFRTTIWTTKTRGHRRYCRASNNNCLMLYNFLLWSKIVLNKTTTLCSPHSNPKGFFKIV